MLQLTTRHDTIINNASTLMTMSNIYYCSSMCIMPFNAIIAR